MKALILAAGLGSRLAPITSNIPKSLVEVNGIPILYKQIDNLLQNGVNDVTIVSGYKHDVLYSAVVARYSNVKILNCKDYASTNNMYSAYFARHELYGQPFLMMNADVFFDSSIIAALLKFSHEDAVVTDIGSYNKESMKVIQQNNRLIEISKEISRKDALGSSIDVYKFSAEGSKAFFDKCAEYIESKDEKKLWSEVALNDIFAKVDFKACPLAGRWLEIDNHDDLQAAENLFSN